MRIIITFWYGVLAAFLKGNFPPVLIQTNNQDFTTVDDESEMLRDLVELMGDVGEGGEWRSPHYGMMGKRSGVSKRFTVDFNGMQVGMQMGIQTFLGVLEKQSFA